MSGLMGSLAAAARALEAQRYGLEVAGQNIANVNTAGYTRRTALLASLPGVDRLSPGNGVEIVGVSVARDERLERRLQQEWPAEHREQALAEVLAVVEASIGRPGESIDRTMSEFFDALGLLASDPTSAISRQQVASQADALARAFNDMAGRLDLARRDADAGIRGGVDQVNGLAARITSLNASLAKAPAGGSESLHLRDEIGEAVKSLSGLVDISTIVRADGGVDISFGNGRPLVIGTNVYGLNSVPSPPSGLTAIVNEGVDVTDEITGGRLGGLLHARDTLVPGYLTQLDTLAYNVATEINAIHQTGYNLAGGTSLDFFVGPAALAGAASSMAVEAGILSDPGTIAAAGSTSVGDNTIARRLAALRDEPVPAGGTATLADAWAQLVYRVGADTKAARDEQSSRSEIVRQVELLREQISGVSLDEEAMMMMKFQRAYEANARYFQAVDQTLDTLIQALGR